MAFTAVTVLAVDDAHVEVLRSNDVIVPYVLSHTPPEEWKSYFEKQAPASAHAKIAGNTAWYTCPKGEAAIRKGGACWTMVTDLVEDANRHCLEMELRRRQELIRQAELQREGEQPSEFEREWGRYISRD